MRVKGYAVVLAAEAMPRALPDGNVGLALSSDTVRALSTPGAADVLMVFDTTEAGWFELLCLADVPRSCADPRHLAEYHGADIEAALNEFKKNHRSA